MSALRASAASRVGIATGGGEQGVASSALDQRVAEEQRRVRGDDRGVSPSMAGKVVVDRLERVKVFAREQVADVAARNPPRR